MWDIREKEESKFNDLIFQTLDWYNTDVPNEETELLEYKIYTFGINIDNKPVSLQINGYFPFFFIEIPNSWDSTYMFTIREVFKGLQDIKFLERKRYYGFENNKLRKFFKLSFYNLKTMRNTRYKIDKGIQIPGRNQPIFFPLYESNIDPILRFMHLRDILSAGWIKITNYCFGENNMYECNWKDINNCPEFSVRLSNIRIMYFDIEACSEDGSFPNALKKNDRVTQICCITKDTVTKETKKYLFNLGTIDSIEDTLIFQYSSEKKLLLSYAKFINEVDPDIIVGYNIFGFDNGYLFERAKVLGIEETFNYQSKINYFTEIEKKILNNQQSGFNDWKMTHLVGRIHIDLLQVIKKDFKLDSYKLNNVGEHFLKQGKDDVSPKEIFEAWSLTGDREKRTRVGKYCVQDTNLCLLLFEKFAVLPNHIEMAKVTRVPLEYLVTRGQSIKVFSQIAYETRKMGYLIPILPKENKESKFQGATVLEARTGYYTRPVAGLDFASLYPSIMIAHNMCYSTVVLDQKYNNIEGVEYSTIDCNENLSVNFVQSQPGVLSGILQSLWKNRKVTKKEMNAATDPFVKTVLNAKQLAIKVSMNSIYGFTGAVVGALPCLEISQSVTGCGRQMIEQTQNYAKNHFQCEIVYGDSVSADTPILIKNQGVIETITIEDLFNKYPKKDYPQFKVDQEGLTAKEQVEIHFSYDYNYNNINVESWTASGWKPIRRIIRHKCNKIMYRVVTPTGIVDVTEDHSLLNENLEEIKPGNLKNENLFHSFPSTVNYLFSQKDIHLIRYLNQTNKYCMKIAVDNKLEANKLYIIGRYLGYGVGLSYDKSFYCLSYYKNNDDYSAQKINSFKNVVDVIKLGTTNDYVYDIETEDGTFQAGIGQMIVKNTDSCYVIFPEPVDSDGTLTTLFKKAEFAASEISKTFRKPIELEFEKFMYPLILVAKKRYMYVEWTDSKQHNGEIEAKGVELVRRDNCGYVKETLDAVLSPIMFENNLEKGRFEAERHIDMLLNGQVPIKKLIISKNLRNDYARPETIAHYQLVEKMKLRDLNSAPKPGDRVPFVYINIKDPTALSWKKVEDPVYVQENNIPIDYLYYFEHQLKNPLKTIFDILLGEMKCTEMFNRSSLIKAKKEEKDNIHHAKRIKENNQDISTFFPLKN
jgi:DNA polymerase delta subunit 1